MTTPNTVHLIQVAVPAGAVDELNRLTVESWERMPESAQLVMAEHLKNNNWDYRAIVGGSMMTQILAMASMGNTVPTEDLPVKGADPQRKLILPS